MKDSVLILSEAHPPPLKSDDTIITQTIMVWLAKELRKGWIEKEGNAACAVPR